MRGHQKYFAVENRDGELAPHFLAVINLPGDPKGLVRAGHERVLRARFAERSFSGRPIRKYRSVIICRNFLRLPMSADSEVTAIRSERMRALARWLAEQWFAGASPGGCCRSGPRRGTCEVRSGHGNGSRVY